MKYYLSLNVPYVFGSLNTVASVFMLTVRRCCIVLRFSKHSMFHIALKTEPNVNFGRTANMGLKSVQESDEYIHQSQYSDFQTIPTNRGSKPLKIENSDSRTTLSGVLMRIF